MVKKSVLLLAYISSISCGSMLDYRSLVGVLQPYDYLEAPRSIITFAHDTEGNKYVIKQYKYWIWKSLLATAVFELVALDLGHALGVPLNSACLIPAGVPFVGKVTEVPATLHTHVPGVPCDEFLEQGSLVYQGLDIKQKEKPYGLTRKLIYHMSRHVDFPAMVALDTFVGNGGRLNHNFFYDESKDLFYGIDMGSAYRMELCSASCENLKEMLADKNTYFTKTEARALVNYYQSFKKLVTLYPTELLLHQIDSYAIRAGFYDTSFFDKEIQASCLDLFAKRKKILKKNCLNAHELVNVLEQLLKQHQLF